METSIIYKTNKCKYKTLVILDWDDTLFPTSWVVKKNIDLTDPDIQNKYIVFFAKLDLLLHKFLMNVSRCGKVVIVTNAMHKWVNISSSIMPNSYRLIKEKIKVVSARDIYQNKYPGDNYLWKEIIFKQLMNEYYGANYNSTHNIISVGDADYEFRALLNLNDTPVKRRKHLKAVRFVNKPSYDTLIDQLEVLNKSFSKIIDHSDHMDLVFNNI